MPVAPTFGPVSPGAKTRTLLVTAGLERDFTPSREVKDLLGGNFPSSFPEKIFCPEFPIKVSQRTNTEQLLAKCYFGAR